MSERIERISKEIELLQGKVDAINNTIDCCDESPYLNLSKEVRMSFERERASLIYSLAQLYMELNIP